MRDRSNYLKTLLLATDITDYTSIESHLFLIGNSNVKFEFTVKLVAGLIIRYLQVALELKITRPLLIITSVLRSGIDRQPKLADSSQALLTEPFQVFQSLKYKVIQFNL